MTFAQQCVHRLPGGVGQAKVRSVLLCPAGPSSPVGLMFPFFGPGMERISSAIVRAAASVSELSKKARRRMRGERKSWDDARTWPPRRDCGTEKSGGHGRGVREPASVKMVCVTPRNGLAKWVFSCLRRCLRSVPHASWARTGDPPRHLARAAVEGWGPAGVHGQSGRRARDRGRAATRLVWLSRALWYCPAEGRDVR